MVAINLANLVITQGLKIFGAVNGEGAGYCVRSAGDINNDGFDDLLIGATSETTVGGCYVIFGKSNGYNTNIDLNVLTMPTGFRITGESIGSLTGYSVNTAGDVNNDGFDDIIIGAQGADPLSRTNAGSSYIIFGKSSGFGDINLSTLSLPIGLKIFGAASGEGCGSWVSNAGDINNDNFSDIIIGSPRANSNKGISYLIFGKSNGFSDIDLNTLTSSTGFKIMGINSIDYSGNTVNTLGDINNDGYDDFSIGAWSASPLSRSIAGEGYIIFGKGSSFSDINLNTLSMPVGFKIFGANNGDQTSIFIKAGDINKDGYGDILVGANGAAPFGRTGAGESYIIFGKAIGFANIDLNSISSTDGFKIYGASSNYQKGASAQNYLGDINGDGFDDTIIGAYNADPLGRTNAGESNVIFGKSSGFSNIDLNSLSSNLGFKIYGENNGDASGGSVSGIGDFNGDGINDIAIGASFASPLNRANAGISYVIYGYTNSNSSTGSSYSSSSSSTGSSYSSSSSSTGFSTSTNTNNIDIPINPDTSYLENFIKIGIPIISGLAGLATIVGGLRTLSKCKNEKIWCFAAEGCLEYTKDWFSSLCTKAVPGVAAVQLANNLPVAQAEEVLNTMTNNKSPELHTNSEIAYDYE